ncbi:hypothetical protein BJP36_39170 [Moorena producens JHB]|uniref:Uncharacterized protein n=1 Tax=Moorena producens (strain JHB) TaxID=1454205 RepID=A0A9Q9SV87_MOOP1|nr:hypothetical protein [Moorena producens]WAN70282.1 hypothetical protein BJP36_39170 [Moorena producens JHB]
MAAKLLSQKLMVRRWIDQRSRYRHCRRCLRCERDINGARGIFLRSRSVAYGHALVDTPWLKNQLALASQNLPLVDFGS